MPGLFILLTVFAPVGISTTEESQPLTAAEALEKVDEEVTVRFEVKSTGGNTAVFLNSESDYRSPKNFAVFIPAAGLLKFYKAKIEEPAEFYKGKTIEVTGTVKLSRSRPQIRVDDPEVLKVIDAETPEPKAKTPAKATKKKGGKPK